MHHRRHATRLAPAVLIRPGSGWDRPSVMHRASPRSVLCGPRLAPGILTWPGMGWITPTVMHGASRRDPVRWSTTCCVTPQGMRSAASSPFGFCRGGVTAKGAGKNVENHDRRCGAPPLRTGGVDLGGGATLVMHRVSPKSSTGSRQGSDSATPSGQVDDEPG